MTRAVSIAAMLEQLDGMRDTNDLTEWEQGFVTNVLHRYLHAGKDNSGCPHRYSIQPKSWRKHGFPPPHSRGAYHLTLRNA